MEDSTVDEPATRRVLIVGGDRNAGLLLQRALEEIGLATDLACDRVATLVALGRSAYDAVLLDVDATRIVPRDLARLLRIREPTRPVRVIARVRAGAQSLPRDLDVHAVLHEPLDFYELVSALAGT